jgi:hypothetical protein
VPDSAHSQQHTHEERSALAIDRHRKANANEDIQKTSTRENSKWHGHTTYMQRIFSSMMAATGRQLKQSVKVFHSLMLYRRLPATM